MVVNEIIKSALVSMPNDSLLLIVTENQNDKKAVAAYYNEKLGTRGSSSVDNSSCVHFKIDSSTQ